MPPLVRLMQPSNTSWVQEAYLLPGGSHSRERERERGRKAGRMTSYHQFKGASYPSKAVCMCVCVFVGFSPEPRQSIWSGYGGIKDKRCGESQATLAFLRVGGVRLTMMSALLTARGRVERAILHPTCMTSHQSCYEWPGSILFSVCLFYYCVCFDHGCSHHAALFWKLVLFYPPMSLSLAASPGTICVLLFQSLILIQVDSPVATQRDWVQSDWRIFCVLYFCQACTVISITAYHFIMHTGLR